MQVQEDICRREERNREEQTSVGIFVPWGLEQTRRNQYNEPPIVGFGAKMTNYSIRYMLEPWNTIALVSLSVC